MHGIQMHAVSSWQPCLHSSADEPLSPARPQGAHVVEFEHLASPCSQQLNGAGAQTAAICSKPSLQSNRSEDTFKQYRDVAENYTPISHKMLQAEMDGLASEVSLWTGQFKYVKTLQSATRNHGRVDLVESVDGGTFAVKRMPTRWVRKGHADFEIKYPTASEKPWIDFAISKLLSKRGFKLCCKLEGIFRDSDNTYVTSSLANRGDLFMWCTRKTPEGSSREELALPIVIQIFAAVRYLHEIGIAHRDLSLENILLHEEASDLTSAPQVKIIDFGMATLLRYVKGEVRGKPSYQAPEMHPENGGKYDGFLADSFALGVSIFCLCVQDYPWTSTEGDKCKLCCYVTTHGLRSFMAKRKMRNSKKSIIDTISPSLTELLEGLLRFNPHDRWCLGETCWDARPKGNRRPSTSNGGVSEERRSVWKCAWIQGGIEVCGDVSVPYAKSKQKSPRRP